jgi:hypothetical protein
MMDEGRMKAPTSFEEFWPGYLNAHSDRRTRMVHLGGTAIGLGCAALFLSTRKPQWAAIALISSYGAAWAAHAIFERNIPATFSHPLWSLRGDFRMLRLALSGRLDEEAAAAQQTLQKEKELSEGT